MSALLQKYCLDTNVLIQAWQKYYSPSICPSYWEVLNNLGIQDRIFIPKAVFEEITRTEDDLSKWIKTSNIPVRELNASVTKCLSNIYAANPVHRFLVDNIKQRSLADPWVIAHAMSEDACVVTKEEKVTAVNTDKIKIPNVCENMKVRCINDFDFIGELEMRFTCRILYI
jgi:rRNA-processing protein FCF1